MIFPFAFPAVALVLHLVNRAVRMPRATTASRARFAAAETIAALVAACVLGLAAAFMSGQGLGSDDVIALVAALVLSGGVLGAIEPRRPWIGALAFDVWVLIGGRIWPAAPPPAAHPPSLPLPLPFGLTVSPTAQQIAGGAIIGSFALIGAGAGALFRKSLHALDTDARSPERVTTRP